MSQPITSFKSLLQHLPLKMSAIADDVGASHDAVRQWAVRDWIPQRHWPKLIKLADAKAVPGVTLELMQRFADRRSAPPETVTSGRPELSPEDFA